MHVLSRKASRAIVAVGADVVDVPVVVVETVAVANRSIQ
jgi:hypothetical protein